MNIHAEKIEFITRFFSRNVVALLLVFNIVLTVVNSYIIINIIKVFNSIFQMPGVLK